MQGIYLSNRRPKSKKEVREAFANGLASSIHIEATSLFGDEFDGFADDLPIGSKVLFVGPDPYTARNFYGKIERRGETDFKVS